VVTANQSRLLADEEVRERRYAIMRARALTKKAQPVKAFVRLHTNLGAINVQLDCDLVRQC
jgi:hypothetical protein